MAETFTLEYADGYYIAKDGVGIIDFDDSENREFAQFVCDAINKACQEESKHKKCSCKKAIAFIDHADWIECVNCHGEKQ